MDEVKIFAERPRSPRSSINQDKSVFCPSSHPVKKSAKKAASSFGDGPFVVAHLDAPESQLEKRNANRKVHEIAYEAPESPTIKIDTGVHSPPECANELFDYLKNEEILL